MASAGRAGPVQPLGGLLVASKVVYLGIVAAREAVGQQGGPPSVGPRWRRAVLDLASYEDSSVIVLRSALRLAVYIFASQH